MSPWQNKKLLITGGTGSFGNAVLKRFLSEQLCEIRILSRDEKKQDDMRNKLKRDNVRFYIGDVRDVSSVEAAMRGVDYVFHAAALKQVPSCEFFPMEAVRTNVIGTDNVLNAAINCGVERVVCLSTDKAVYPVNAMGMSKALMEKVMVAKSQMAIESSTVVCGTRYGNVMASRGSVIPLFIDQIMAGQPLTITDPSMTRFLMSLDDAVDLVLYAFEHASAGDLFVQKSPASTIGDLAQALLELFEVNNEIKVIGTRHGEKKHETLMNREEMTRAEDQRDYFRISADTRDLNYAKYFTAGKEEVSRIEDYSSDNTVQLTVPQIKESLLRLEYVQRALETYKQNLQLKQVAAANE